jgi:RNA polymerase sigma-70 factor, ECF subfamily
MDGGRGWLAERFEGERTRLSGVAYRMLGSRSDAEDALQESWVRISRADAAEIANLGGWLTTVVARVCLDMLRSRKSRREELVADDPRTREPSAEQGPEHEAVLADSIGLALLVVLETLSPAERVAFVLHDMFDVPFEEIAPIVGRSPAAARQLASRARRRVQGAKPDGGADARRRSEVVRAFLAASRSGDLECLISLLDPSVVLRADAAAVATGATAEVHGAAAVAATFSGRARAARPALVHDAVCAGVGTGRNASRGVRIHVRRRSHRRDRPHRRSGSPCTLFDRVHHDGPGRAVKFDQTRLLAVFADAIM